MLRMLCDPCCFAANRATAAQELAAESKRTNLITKLTAKAASDNLTGTKRELEARARGPSWNGANVDAFFTRSLKRTTSTIIDNANATTLVTLLTLHSIFIQGILHPSVLQPLLGLLSFAFLSIIDTEFRKELCLIVKPLAIAATARHWKAFLDDKEEDYHDTLYEIQWSHMTDICYSEARYECGCRDCSSDSESEGETYPAYLGCGCESCARREKREWDRLETKDRHRRELCQARDIDDAYLSAEREDFGIERASILRSWELSANESDIRKEHTHLPTAQVELMISRLRYHMCAM
jgi:hypothetical protein